MNRLAPLAAAVGVSILLIGTTFDLAAQQSGPIRIFDAVPSMNDARQQSRVVRPRIALLEDAGRRGADVVLSLPGGDVVATLTRFEIQPQGFFAAGPITRASVPGARVEGEVSFTVVGDNLVGRVVTRGRVFRIGRLTSSVFHQLEEVNLSRLAPDGEPVVPVASIGGTPTAFPVTADPGVVADTNAFIDLLLVYTPNARTTLGGTAAMQAEAIAAVNNANLALANSGVVHRYRVAYLGEVGYTESGSSSTDLSRLKTVGDGYLDEVHGLRDTYRADVVTLLTQATDVCGTGYLLPAAWVNTSLFVEYAFNITIALSCANANLSLPHEVGHNMGLQHDRLNGSSAAFTFAFGYTVPGFARTVMAYACATGGTCPRRAVFSSPLVNFPGSAVVAGTATEDNARALDLTSAMTANYRNTDCNFSLNTNAIVVGPAGGSGGVAVTSSSGCGWNAVSSDSTVATITGGAISSGSANASYTIGASASPRSATLTIAGQSVSVTQNVAPPSAFSKTGPANGSSGQPLSSTLNWGSSAGATSYEYCIDTSNDNACSSWMSTGTATSAGLTGLPATTTHYWHVRANNAGGSTYAGGSATAFWTFTTGAAAFGQVDTPSQNAADLQGAVGVTGWALDDAGVTKVEIFRNCLGGVDAPNCQTVLGNSVVYVGAAAFLPGARPDVEAAFPTYPNKNRAGWGYLMLTPMLPHVPTAQPFGGQGALTLYVVATDAEGNRSMLGRSSDPASPDATTPTAITMANDTIAKPFGSIDTPGQGETIGGVFNNFGWALTPDSNPTGGDPDDILIPTNGSSVTVFIDGLPMALVAYNQCRGNVGNPVPGGAYCNDDVANIFGNVVPQPALTTRTSNPTKFRNLDAARAAIGAHTFDTASLSNGLHTMAWSVTDSMGRTEGIGSRFFNVLNGGSPAQLRRGLPAGPKEAAPLAATMSVRTGFDLATAWKPMTKVNGQFAVSLQELDRLELWLGAPIDAAYLVANDQVQPLPVGTSLTGSRFAWMPPAGYFGSYHLMFVRGGQRVDVKVTVIEKARPRVK